jgi:hypothetical protein
VELRSHSVLSNSTMYVASVTNPLLMGWIDYYACYTPSAGVMFRCVNQALLASAMRKFKRVRGHKTGTSREGEQRTPASSCIGGSACVVLWEPSGS